MKNKAKTITQLVNSIEYDKPNGKPYLMLDTKHKDFNIHPYLNVAGFVDKLGHIVLNVSAEATGGCGVVSNNDYLTFQARFNQVAYTVTFHQDSVIAVFDANEEEPINLLEELVKQSTQVNAWNVFTRLMVFLQKQANSDLCLEVDLINTNGNQKLIFQYDKQASVVCFKDTADNKNSVLSDPSVIVKSANFKVQYMVLKDTKAGRFLFVGDTEKHIVLDSIIQDALTDHPKEPEETNPTPESLGPNVVDFSSFRDRKKPSP